MAVHCGAEIKQKIIEMTKSFSITVPDPVEKALGDWAQATGRTRGSLIAFLLETLARLKYPERFDSVELPQDVDIADHQAMLAFVAKLSKGQLSRADVTMISHITDVDSEALQHRVDKAQKGNENHAPIT